MRSISFFGNLCLVYRRATSAWAFLQGDLNSLGLTSFLSGGFISVIAIYDFFLLFFCSIYLFSHVVANLIWLMFVVQERGCIDFLGQTLDIELASSFSNWLGWQGSSSSRHLQGFPDKIYRLVLFFQISIHWHLLFFTFILKNPIIKKNQKILKKRIAWSQAKPLLGFVDRVIP